MVKYRKCQRACEDLDHKQRITAPDMAWFWPDRRVPKPDDEEAETDEKTEEETEDEDDDIEYEVKGKFFFCYI